MEGFQCFISIPSELVSHCDFKCLPLESEVLSQMMDQRRLTIFYRRNHFLAKGTATVNLPFLSL